MDQGSFPSHLAANNGDPRGRGRSRDTIHEAVALIATEHQVLETAAYEILVRESLDRSMSVRETATQIVGEGPGA